MRMILLALFFCSCSMADTITLTMTEVPNQLIDGLTVSKGGVDFTFTNPARSLVYNSGGPGSITFVQDPSLAGESSPFRITFSAPVSSVQFGLAENIGTLGGSLAVVDLFNGGAVPFATSSLTASLVDPFAEGLFRFAGGPLTSLRITPNSAAPVVAFDNLSVDTAAIPEPASVVLTAAGLLWVAWKRARRRARSGSREAGL
jgi:hypothetical protein